MARINQQATVAPVISISHKVETLFERTCCQEAWALKQAIVTGLILEM